MSDSPKNTYRKNYEHEYDPKSKVDALAMDLELKLSDTMTDRNLVEMRMVEDLRNYNGIYDPETLKAIKENDGCQAFIKLTKAKTNAGKAQLIDLLFPNDDKNWGIDPTPDPDLAAMVEDEETPFREGDFQFKDQQGNIVSRSQVAKRKQAMVDEACDKMRQKIDDQLVETRYNAKSRRIIHDACVVGSGVVKGPVVLGKTDKVYLNTPEGFQQVLKHSFVPGCEVVRPWDFFPDMSASTIEEAEFVFERRFLSRKQVRNLPRRRGFDRDRVKKLLAMTAQQTQHRSTYMDDIRTLAGLSDTLNDTRFETWEYHGPIAREVLEELEVIEPMDEEHEDYQDEIDAVVFYCGGIVLGAKLSLMEYSQAMPYRVFCWEPDDACIFGYGIPRSVRDEQSIINAFWRMMVDNGAITSGPQLGIRKDRVKPRSGEDWKLRPKKLWELNGNVQDIKQAMSAFEFNNHIADLSSVYQVARVLFDEVSGVPMLQQGEQGPASQTLGGMSMLMNAANTVRREQVKYWDDHITTPLISDFYHFNMEHSDDNEIKGDFQIQARGTSALLIKEQVAQAMTNFINTAGNSEVFRPVLALKATEILREWAKTQQLPKSIIPTEDELKAYHKQQEESAGQPSDPAIVVEQMRQQGQQAKMAFEKELAQQKHQMDMSELHLSAQTKQQEIAASMQANESAERIEVMKLAQAKQINTEKLLTELEKIRTRNQLEWDKFMAEVRIKQNAGQTANYGLE
ncbi:portal protein [Paraferrimonas sedimenticola]|uniref:Portal protein n=1 Tax=Paraferrimonas sedimenticola TaxID=375674 RepID=A0AA37RUX2_9GAMM|nr:hypothetical protein [Paraferrimonas sedimenticola]GLP95294.1 hypothetical protein GCM10007895_06000 [Paraferrimonas sedimenticola]